MQGAAVTIHETAETRRMGPGNRHKEMPVANPFEIRTQPNGTRSANLPGRG